MFHIHHHRSLRSSRLRKTHTLSDSTDTPIASPMDLPGGRKLLPPPPLDQVLYERKKLQLLAQQAGDIYNDDNTYDEDEEDALQGSRRPGMDAATTLRSLTWTGFADDCLRYSEETATPPHSSSSHTSGQENSPDGRFLTPDETLPSTPNSIPLRSHSACSRVRAESAAQASPQQDPLHEQDNTDRPMDSQRSTPRQQEVFTTCALSAPSQRSPSYQQQQVLRHQQHQQQEEEWTICLGGTFNLSSDASSSAYSRGSVWSRRDSHTSYETLGSSLAGDNADTLPMSKSAPADVTNFAVGITSHEVPPVRICKAPIVNLAQPPHSMSNPTMSGRYDHHRNPSWARRPCLELLSSTQSSEGRSQSDQGFSATTTSLADPFVGTGSDRPSLGRMTSASSLEHRKARINQPVGQPVLVLPAGAIPPRTKSRTHLRRSESSSSKSRECKPLSVDSGLGPNLPDQSPAALVTISSGDNHIERSLDTVSPISPLPTAGFNSRKSSLRSSVGASQSKSPSKASLRAANIRPAPHHLAKNDSKTSLTSTSCGGSGIEEMDEAGSLLPYTRGSSGDSRRNSDAMLDLAGISRALGEASSNANAIKVVEAGKGRIVEARNRHPLDFEGEIGAETTHLLLSQCSSAELPDLLDRVLPLCSQNLLVLDLANTGLQTLPACLTHCSQLEELNISGNTLFSLPQWIDSLPNLRILLANEMCLSALPFAMSCLGHLSVLSLRDNRLTHLPSWLHRLGSLERLYLQGNPFQGPWVNLLSSLLPGQIVEASPRSDSSRLPWVMPFMTSPNREESPDTQTHISQSGDRLTQAKNHNQGIGRIRRISTAEVSSMKLPEGRQLAVSRFSTDSTIEILQDDSVSPSRPNAIGSPSRSFFSHDHSTRNAKTTESDSKWGFFKRVTRKGSNSSINLLHQEAARREEHSASARNRNGSAMSFRSVSSLTGTPFPSPGSEQMSTSRDEGHARMVTPDKDHQTAKACASSPGSRLSFLPLQNAPVNQLSTTEDPKRKEDPIEEFRFVRALLCYLRDLDDLALQSNSAMRDSRSSSIASLSSASGSFSPSHIGVMPMSTSLSGHSFDSVESGIATPISETSFLIRRQPSAPVLLAGTCSSPIEVKDNAMRRSKIIGEIIASEESYLRGLQELCDIYVRPARQLDPSSGHSILTPQEHRSVFGNVEGLLQFHQGAFLPSLRHAADALSTRESLKEKDETNANLTAGVAEAIAGVFCKHAAFFRMYSTYINGCDEAQARITAWTAASNGSNGYSLLSGSKETAAIKDGVDHHMSSGQKKKFKAFMKRCRADPKHSQLNLQSYTLLPVQRLPRYEMLLKELARCTDPARLLNPLAVNTALAQISSIAASVNESKRQSEQDKKLLAWQARLRGKWPVSLVQPHRRLVRDGVLTLCRVVERVAAFDVTGEVDSQDVNHDGAFAGQVGDIKRVDCLKQSTFAQQLTLLLCNDICVTLRDARTPSISSTFTAADSTRQVELYAILRIQPSGPDFKLCELVGRSKNLRIVDAKRIYYFSASTPAEAAAWCESINNSAGVS